MSRRPFDRRYICTWLIFKNKCIFSFQNRVIIHEVHKDGAADKDGRLKPGDFIVSVDGKAMLECTHKDALRALRVTKDKVRNSTLKNIQDLNFRLDIKVHSFLKQSLNDLHFMETRSFSPTLSKLAPPDISWMTLFSLKFGLFEFLEASNYLYDWTTKRAFGCNFFSSVSFFSTMDLKTL